jgi:O-antigen/teichoic acid export membrane protein
MTTVRQSLRPLLGSVSLTRNVLLNWASMGLSILATFFVTPVVVRGLHQELYGAWSFLNGLLVYTDVLYLGLGASLIKAVATHKSNADHAAMNRVTSAVFSIYTLLGTICLLALASASPAIPHAFARPLSSPQAEWAVSFACVMLGVQLFASFAGSAFSGVLFGLDRVDLAGFVRVATVVVRSIAIVGFVGGPNPLVSLATVTASASLFEAAAMAVLALVLEPGFSVRPVVPTREELRALYGFGLQAFTLILALALINYTDTTVIGVVIGASSVAVYALPLQLVEYIRTAASGVSGVWFPRLTVMAGRQDLAGLRAAYVTVSRLTTFIAAFLAANVIALGPAFLGIWVGPEFAHVQWIVACLATATLLHIFAVTAPMAFYYALDTLKIPALVLLAEAGANLALSVALAPRLGVLGVAIGTLVPAALVGGILLPSQLRKTLGLSVADLLRPLAPAVVVFAGTAGLLAVLGLAIADRSYVHLAAKAALASPVLVVVFILMFPNNERNDVVRRIPGQAALRTRLASVARVVRLRRARMFAAVLVAAAAGLAIDAQSGPHGWLPGMAAAGQESRLAADGRLLQSADLVLGGVFHVPADVPGKDGRGLDWGGTAIAYNPAHDSLFIVGHDWDQAAAEISIPPVGGTARLIQALADPVEGLRVSVDTDKVGGLFVWNGQLIVTKFGYFDATHSQVASHFLRPLDLGVRGQVRGPHKIGALGAGFYSGYMASVPAIWQARLGGPLLTGNCCLSILGRTSYGPAVSTVDPARIGVKEDATALVFYTQEHQTLGEYGAKGKHPVFNGSTRIRGIVFPEGTSSVLFVGTTGIGDYCYGYAPDCGAPGYDKGEHAFPYRAYVWAYDAVELAQVRSGRKKPWDVKPYATWELPLGDINFDTIAGVAYDPATSRVFISQKLADGALPLIHVFTIRR